MALDTEAEHTETETESETEHNFPGRPAAQEMIWTGWY